ncbi:MAG: ATP-binding protein [Cyclobacteriaceae bacterium]
MNILIYVPFIWFLSSMVNKGTVFVKIFSILVLLFIVILFASNSAHPEVFFLSLGKKSLQLAYYFGCIWILVRGYKRENQSYVLVIVGFLIYIFTEYLVATDPLGLWKVQSSFRKHLTAIGYSSSFVLYAIYLAKDLAITSRKLAIELENNANLRIKNMEADKLRELDELKSRFFANISHEFRTPLTLLFGPIERRLASGTASEDKAELKIMHRNTSRLLNLVNQLLDLSKFEAGKMKLQASEIDLSEFMKVVISEFESLAAARKIKLNCTANPVVGYFDLEKLHKILNNLLSNAFKFTPDRGEIDITLRIVEPDREFKKGSVLISVRDTGAGIAHEHIAKIFDRFYQADDSLTKPHEGSGIGLALAREMVHLHYGIIEVKSTPGTGSIFAVRLPLGKDHLKTDEIAETQPSLKVSVPFQEVAETREREEIHSEEKRETLLIIEDNADLLEYLNKGLIDGYHVVLAADGRQGYDYAMEHIPTLIVSDLMMPKMDGLALCSALKEDERTSHIPIVLLTAKAEIESRLEGFRLGADEYLAKPFSMDELNIRIANLIKNRKRLQQKYKASLALEPTMLTVNSMEEKFLKTVISTVEAHIADTGFGVETLAAQVGMSQVQLYRKLQALTEYSPNEFIRHMRLLRAANLLDQKAGNVAEVAYQSGFNNLSYFAKVFKAKFGSTPSEYARKQVITNH